MSDKKEAPDQNVGQSSVKISGMEMVTPEDLSYLGLVLIETQLNLGRVRRQNAQLQQNQQQLLKILKEKEDAEKKAGLKKTPLVPPSEMKGE